MLRTLRRLAKICKFLHQLVEYGERPYLGKGGDDEVFTVPGGEEVEVRFGAGGVNYIEVFVHLDQSQYDKAGEGGRHSHKKYFNVGLMLS